MSKDQKYEITFNIAGTRLTLIIIALEFFWEALIHGKITVDAETDDLIMSVESE